MDVSGYDPVAYLSELLDVVPENFVVGEELNELIGRFERFSIDDVFGAAQLKVLRILKDSSRVIDAASIAAGLPTVTYYKRMRRITDRISLLSILDDAQKPD